MGMNNFAKALNARGLSVREAARKPGCKYVTVYKHYKDERNVGVKAALLYEEALGIPRSELRPDIWPPGGGSDPSPTPEARP